MNELLKKILKKRIIEKLNSWSFSFIKKKDGSTKIYIIDYRRVQKLLKKNFYPLSKIKEILDILFDSVWFYWFSKWLLVNGWKR